MHPYFCLILFLHVSHYNYMYEISSPFLSFKACSKYDLFDLLLHFQGKHMRSSRDSQLTLLYNCH